MEEGNCLENLGFSRNEAKVYTTLLKHKQLNGYEIAKLSGVSRSLVYEVINRLVGKGILLRLEGEPNYYKPLEYDKLIRRMKQESENHINKAEEYLKGLMGEEENRDFVMNLVGFDKFIKKAIVLIDSASKEISLSVWSNEFELLQGALTRAMERGVKVYLFTFEEVNPKGAVLFSYRISDAASLFPYRRMTLVVDGEQCLTGENNGDRSIFIYTKNHAIVSLATDEIVLNIFWYKYMEKRGLLRKKNSSEEFLQIIEALAKELGINEDMTKNLMVYEFQRRKYYESEEH
mgnify:CR=1 FL=1